MTTKNFITQEIKNLISNTPNNNYYIIAGDFNVVIDKHLDKLNPTKGNSYAKIFDTFKELEYIDTFRVIHPDVKQFTWSHPNSNSMRIDYIWLSPNWWNELLQGSIIDASLITQSDHHIVSFVSNMRNIIRNHSRSQSKHNENERLIFDYASMDNDKWESYADLTNDKFANSQLWTLLDKSDHNHNDVNEIWKIIKDIMLTVQKDLFLTRK